jgi:nicotinamidase/pyrazinamidase
MENVALIIMDMQNDFCNGSPLANTKSLKIIPIINKLKEKFKYVFLTKEQHQSNHSSFKKFGGKYPSHCVENTKGNEFNEYLNISKDDIIIERGMLQKFDSSSAFYDAEEIKKKTNLRNILKINNINKLYFCGMNADTSMFSTIMDAINYKYKCYVYADAIAYADEDMYIKRIEYLTKLGIFFL